MSDELSSWCAHSKFVKTENKWIHSKNEIAESIWRFFCQLSALKRFIIETFEFLQTRQTMIKRLGLSQHQVAFSERRTVIDNDVQNLHEKEPATCLNETIMKLHIECAEHISRLHTGDHDPDWRACTSDSRTNSGNEPSQTPQPCAIHKRLHAQEISWTDSPLLSLIVCWM